MPQCCIEKFRKELNNTDSFFQDQTILLAVPSVHLRINPEAIHFGLWQFSLSCFSRLQNLVMLGGLNVTSDFVWIIWEDSQWWATLENYLVQNKEISE